MVFFVLDVQLLNIFIASHKKEKKKHQFERI